MTRTHRLRALVTALLGAALAAALTGVPAPAAVAATTDAANTTAIDVPDSSAYNHSGAALPIPDSGSAGTYPSQITMSGMVGTVIDVSVRLDLVQHGSLEDLDVMLVGPGGQNALVMSDAGAGAVAGVTLFLDDEGPSELPDSTVPTNGSYRPTNYGAGDVFPAPAPTPTGSALSVFDGTDPNGTWQLYVVDDSTGSSGSLAGGWKLVVRTTKTSSVYPAPITVAGLIGPITDVDLTLHGLTHTFSGDLDVLVVGPGGQRALVMSDAGDGDDVAGIDLVIDDEAAAPLPYDLPLQTGSYRPTDHDVDAAWGDVDEFAGDPGDTADDGSALSVFDGTDPNGTWKLYVEDDVADDTGTIAGGWSLRISTADPATPATVPGTTAPTPSSSTSSPAVTDTVHPKVGATTPRPGATRAAPRKDLRVTFTESIRRSTLTERTVKLVRKGTTLRIPVTLTYDRATHTVTLDPSRRLRQHTTYKVVVTTGVKDIAGNALDQKPSVAGNQKATWTFRTR
jgi:subtilisin-like proprotein convertase family protein